MHRNFKHFILTRFNLATPGREETLRSASGWLDRRIELFEQYCLPSVDAQTTHDFLWLIYMDERTEEAYRDGFAGYDAREYVEIRYVDGREFTIDTARQDIATRLQAGQDWVITTRLDNDDAIGCDFVRKIQDQASFTRREILNFPSGITLRGNDAYLQTDRSNAFSTMVEPRSDNILTVWCRQHIDLPMVAPVVQIRSAPAWCQVIHGENVTNRVKGRRIRLKKALKDFPFGADSEEVERTSEIVFDNLVLFPVRFIRNFFKLMIYGAFHLVERLSGVSPSELIRRRREK